jgi:hypothetical protein
MVILILGGGIFLGFGLGIAAMALLDARHQRLQCENAKERSSYALRLEVDRAAPAGLPSSGASCQLFIVS